MNEQTEKTKTTSSSNNTTAQNVRRKYVIEEKDWDTS